MKLKIFFNVIIFNNKFIQAIEALQMIVIHRNIKGYTFLYFHQKITFCFS